jgi:hypothetical protein
MCVFTGHDYWMVSLQKIIHSIPCYCISYYQMNDWELKLAIQLTTTNNVRQRGEIIFN